MTNRATCSFSTRSWSPIWTNFLIRLDTYTTSLSWITHKYLYATVQHQSESFSKAATDYQRKITPFPMKNGSSDPFIMTGVPTHHVRQLASLSLLSTSYSPLPTCPVSIRHWILTAIQISTEDVIEYVTICNHVEGRPRRRHTYHNHVTWAGSYFVMQRNSTIYTSLSTAWHGWYWPHRRHTKLADGHAQLPLTHLHPHFAGIYHNATSGTVHTSAWPPCRCDVVCVDLWYVWIEPKLLSGLVLVNVKIISIYPDEIVWK